MCSYSFKLWNKLSLSLINVAVSKVRNTLKRSERNSNEKERKGEEKIRKDHHELDKKFVKFCVT